MHSLPAAKPSRTLVRAVGLGILYFIVASPTAQTEHSVTLAAIAWPAPAIAIALLWREPWRQWPPYLLAVFIAMLLVGDVDWLTDKVDAGFATLNVLEISLCAWLGKRFVAPDGDLATIAQLIRFLLLLPFSAVAMVSVLGASLASFTMETDWWHEWRVLLVGNGLAILVLVPALLAWYRPAPRTRSRTTSAVYISVVLGVAGVTAVLAIAVFFKTSEGLLRVMLSLVLVSTAVYGGINSASTTVGVASVWGIGLTMFGIGPYRCEGLESTWRLQVDLAGLAVLTFFVAIALRERQELTERLEQARRFEFLGMLASGIAHDFNNILGAVGGYAELAEERLEANSLARSPLGQVLSAVARGKDLTEQILLATRRGDRVRAPLDLRDVVRDAVALAQPLCRAGIVLEVAQSDAAVMVLAHRAQIMRALLNLLCNASQAARSRVVIALGSGAAAADDEMLIGDMPLAAAAWITVCDDGMGIAPAHMHQLFDPFFSTRDGADGKGTGLGLAIVAGIATEHDGSVGVRSAAGEGTRFRFILPLAAADARNAPFAPAPPPRAAFGNGERVLLLEDDRELRERYEDWLAELGFEPLGYGDPVTALAMAATAPGDIFLLLTDLDMPALRGDEMATRLRALKPQLPVVICSGSPDLAVAAQQSDAVALVKPFDRDDLARAIMQAVNRDRQNGFN